jgi:hypothetical protein
MNEIIGVGIFCLGLIIAFIVCIVVLFRFYSQYSGTISFLDAKIFHRKSYIINVKKNTL